MDNRCINRLTVLGSKEQVQRFLKSKWDQRLSARYCEWMENFPGRVEKRPRAESRGSRVILVGWFLPSTLDARLSSDGKPRFQVLLKAFLGLEMVRNNDNRLVGENVAEQKRQKRLGGGTNSGHGQHSAILHSPCEGLHSGSFQDVGEPVACRRRCRVLRQAGTPSQWKVKSSSRRRSPGHGRFVSGFAVDLR